jgi:hypothetical protein
MAPNCPQAIIGCAQKKICIIDIRKMNSIVSTFDSPLKEQTRIIACFPDNTGYAIGSIEGRVSIRFKNFFNFNFFYFKFLFFILNNYNIKDIIKKKQEKKVFLLNVIEMVIMVVMFILLM